MGVGGWGKQQQQQIFLRKLLIKNILLRILAKKYMPKEEKRKRFQPYMYKKILHLLKSPLPHIHPHHYSNGPSLEMAEVGYCLIIFIFRYI